HILNVIRISVREAARNQNTDVLIGLPADVVARNLTLNKVPFWQYNMCIQNQM
ncbi:739_t:CDS:1, partial [Dentiscutata heterogama]